MEIFEKVISSIVIIEIDFFAITTDFYTCQAGCKKINGYIPYLSEVLDKNS